MPDALRIRCGSWKQSPCEKCECGFQPAKGSLDEAKSFVLSDQFRSVKELGKLARAIQSGVSLQFDEKEVRRAVGLSSWNMAVNIGLLSFVVLLGVFVAALFSDVSTISLAILAGTAIVVFLVTGALIGIVRRRVEGLHIQDL